MYSINGQCLFTIGRFLNLGSLTKAETMRLKGEFSWFENRCDHVSHPSTNGSCVWGWATVYISMVVQLKNR